jgi:hypothetical protein
MAIKPIFRIQIVILLILGLMFLVQRPVHAVCIQGDCDTGKGSFQFDDGGVYKGEWEKGKMHGKGRFSLDNKWVEGIWQNSKLVKITRKKTGQNPKPYIPPAPKPYRCLHGDCKDGFGTYQYQFGQYEGYWQNGNRHGSGDFYWNEGDHYSGEWRNDRMNGFGFYAYKNGNKYSGQWSNNKKHGHGVFWKSDGTILKGEWKKGEMLSTTITTSKPGSDEKITNRQLLNYLFYSNQSINKNIYRLKNRTETTTPTPTGEEPIPQKETSENDLIQTCAALKEEVLRIQEALEGRQSLEKKAPTGNRLLISDSTSDTGEESRQSEYYHDKYYTRQDLLEALANAEKTCAEVGQ